MSVLNSAKQDLKAAPVFIGSSEQAKRIRHFIGLVESTDHNILLLGENGTGKGVVAEMIHYGGRRSKPFVTVNCVGVPETLLETELFGHTRGAFTDAKFEKIGLLQLAEGGTAFIDEVAEIGIAFQSKFLRVIEKKPYRKVGGIEEIPVKTRIIAATNVDMEQAVEEKKLRLDLFHRLNKIVFTIPPLRERRGDILELAMHFLSMENESKWFSQESQHAMLDYHWPGNVRELQNAVSRAALFSEDLNEIQPQHLVPYFTNVSYEGGKKKESTHFPSSFFNDNGDIVDLQEAQRRAQKSYIGTLLETADNNMSHAAAMAGIRRSYLYVLMGKLQITTPQRQAGRPKKNLE